MKIKAVIWQEDGVWCASVPALPGCHTWGESYEQLLEMLGDAIQGWLEVASQQEELEPEKQVSGGKLTGCNENELESAKYSHF
jgi:predicted RNase H-like HicB family nuclease